MWGVQVQTQAEEDQILAGTMWVPTGEIGAPLMAEGVHWPCI